MQGGTTMFRDLFLALSTSRTVADLVTGHAAFRRMARRFVAGETLDEALRVLSDLRARGLACSLDHLGESVTDADTARQAVTEYLRALDRLAHDGIPSHVSIKLTQMGLDLSHNLCLENSRTIVARAKQAGTFVTIDMEGSAYTQRTLDIYRALHQEFPNVGVAIQAYLYRSQNDVAQLAAEGATIRLCKGAYKEPPSIAYPKKADVDANYRRLLEIYLRPEYLAKGAYVAVATHDEKIIRWTLDYTRAHNIPTSAFEFQMLYGIRRDLQLRLAAQGYVTRIYVPYGTHWYPYFMRRLAERPANTFFLLRNLLRG